MRRCCCSGRRDIPTPRLLQQIFSSGPGTTLHSSDQLNLLTGWRDPPANPKFPWGGCTVQLTARHVHRASTRDGMRTQRSMRKETAERVGQYYRLQTVAAHSTSWNILKNYTKARSICRESELLDLNQCSCWRSMYFKREPACHLLSYLLVQREQLSLQKYILKCLITNSHL